MGILLHGRYLVSNKQLQRGNTIDASKKGSICGINRWFVCVAWNILFYSVLLLFLVTDSTYIIFSNFFFQKEGSGT